ncbi:uncharacterized protein LOC110457955 [Mizuhopecten yessoensis]|uniref:uncharacterized protein LOC110457955 n=1 Tax=Mizuhopecten yessoensis TaxID=6573 RepID=UPI000B45C40C|nr:uncharacterized protein LOC110457955 [Mizuhopecten yessoensis]
MTRSYEAYKALNNHYLAFIFIRAISPQSKDLLRGGEICKTELEQLVGYFKNGGNTLCLVMFPELQAVNKATCCQSECCGRNTRCQENSHVNHNYLVYCDAFYSDPNGAPIGDQSVPPMIDEDGLTIPGYDGSGDIPPPVNQPTLFNGYFAIHHDTFPSVCTCKTSHC